MMAKARAQIARGVRGVPENYTCGNCTNAQLVATVWVRRTPHMASVFLAARDLLRSKSFVVVLSLLSKIQSKLGLASFTEMMKTPTNKNV